MKQHTKDLVNLYFFNMRLGLRRLIAGIGYWRSIEYQLVISNMELEKQDTILDIGSGQSPFPVFLASKGHKITVTDVDIHSINAQLKWAKKHSLNDFVAELNDVTKLTYDENTFDKVLATSVLEHIEGDGDTKATKEIARVLKPDGTVFITLPFATEFAEYDGKDRWYDERALEKRVVKPSALEIVRKEYYEEAIPFSKCFHQIPLLVRALFLWLQPILSLILLRNSTGYSRKVCLVAMILQKRIWTRHAQAD